MLPFYWNEGLLINHGFGIVNRQNNTVGDQPVLECIGTGGAIVIGIMQQIQMKADSIGSIKVSI